MKTTAFLPFGSAILWTTILCTIIIVVSIVILVQRAMATNDNITRIMYWGVTALLAVTMLVTVAICPRKAVVKDNALDIRMVAWKLHIPAEIGRASCRERVSLCV